MIVVNFSLYPRAVPKPDLGFREETVDLAKNHRKQPAEEDDPFCLGRWLSCFHAETSFAKKHGCSGQAS
jgi:hypothetical protein